MAALRNFFKGPVYTSGVRYLSNSVHLSQNTTTRSTPTTKVPENHEPTVFEDNEPVKVSKAMKSYMARATAYDEFIKQQLHQYNVGKRHLANMMGRDPEFFTQDDVDEAIRYLFPSGLYDPKARPMMKHPEELYPKKKAAEFDITGRPHHYMFYTGKPNYYTLLHDVSMKGKRLDDFVDRRRLSQKEKSSADELNLSGSEWLPKTKVESMLLETINDAQYNTLIKTLERFCQHPFAFREKEFIMQYRRNLGSQSEFLEIPKPLRDEKGRPYTVYDGRRKMAKASVKVTAQGTGLIEINGKDILYFEHKQEREQIMFPLIFTDLIGRVDIVATVSGGGPSGQAGAIRYATSMCLRPFVDDVMIERMRLAGLLSFDPRKKERKKPGQAGARKKFTWKKR